MFLVDIGGFWLGLVVVMQCDVDAALATTILLRGTNLDTFWKQSVIRAIRSLASDKKSDLMAESK